MTCMCARGDSNPHVRRHQDLNLMWSVFYPRSWLWR